MTLAQRLFGDGRFCCVAHRRRFREENEQAALEVLQRFRDAGQSADSSPLARKVRTESGLEAPLGDWVAEPPLGLAGTVRAEITPAEPVAAECSPSGPVPLPPKVAAAPSPSVSRSWPPAQTAPRAGDALARLSAMAARDCSLPRPLQAEPLRDAASRTVVAPEEFHDPLFRKTKRGARLDAAFGLYPAGGVESLPVRGALGGRMPPFRRAETGAAERPEDGAILVPEEFGSPAPRAMARDLWLDVPAGSGSAYGPGSIPARACFAGQSPFPRAATSAAIAPCVTAATPRSGGCTPVVPALAARMAAPAALDERPAQEPRWILSRPRPLPPETPALLVAVPSRSSAVCVPAAGAVESDPAPAAPPEAAGLLCTLSIYLWSPGPAMDFRRVEPCPDFAPPRSACLPLPERGPLAMPVPRRKIRSGPAAAVPGETVSPRFESGPAASSLSPARVLPAGARVESEREPAPPGLAWLATELEIAVWQEVREAEAQPEASEDEFHVTMKLARPRLIRETPELKSLSERLWRVYVPRFYSPTLRPRLSAGPRPAAAFGY